MRNKQPDLRILTCMKTRAGNQESCGTKCAADVLIALRKELQRRGLPAAHVNAQPSGCLGRCEDGPILMGFTGRLAEQADPSQIEEELLDQSTVCFEHVTVDQIPEIVETLMKLTL
jgi:(2Fe-2S) ferredoxin